MAGDSASKSKSKSKSGRKSNHKGSSHTSSSSAAGYVNSTSAHQGSNNAAYYSPHPHYADHDNNAAHYDDHFWGSGQPDATYAIATESTDPWSSYSIVLDDPSRTYTAQEIQLIRTARTQEELDEIMARLMQASQ